MSNRQPDSQTEDDLNRLMKSVGPRPEPPADIRDAVLGAVQAEFDALNARRPSQRLWLGSVAAVLVAALVTVLVWPSAPQVVATLAQSGHPLTVQRDGQTVTLIDGEQLVSGDMIVSTQPVAIRMLKGSELRLDTASHLRLVDAQSLQLISGALYIDSGSGGDEGLTVTADGLAIAHIGTQYLVEHRNDGDVRVSVREGAVRVEGVESALQAGESARLSDRRLAARSTVAAVDGRWAWVANAAPPLVLNGMSLAEFCRWFEKQTGRKVRYLQASDSSKARTVELSGSTDGLTPDAALNAVLLSAEFEIVSRTPETVTLHYRLP